MIKRIPIMTGGEPGQAPLDQWGPPVTVINPRGPMTKTALDASFRGKRFDLRIESWIAKNKPEPWQTILVVAPLGAYETWGPNTNADGFEREWIEPDNNEYGHKTFELFGGIFRHHKNSDPSKSMGNIPLAVYDRGMDRVEFVAVIDRRKAEAFGHQIVLDELDRDVLPDVSMGCFPSGTPITMADGTTKPIEEIQVGDLVLSHTGKEVTVSALHPRDYDGDLIEVDLQAGSTFRVTPNHPFWSARREDVFRDRRWTNDPVPEWRHIGCLEEGDLLSFPVPRADLTHDYANRALARLLGYYLAEGSILYRKNGNYAGISLATHVADPVHLELEELCREFGVRNAPVTTSRDYSKYVRIVEIHDAYLAELCHLHCGKLAREKRLSQEVMRWDPKLQAELLGAYINGDGWQNGSEWQPGSVGISTASDYLAQQIPLMLSRCGVIATVNQLRHESGGGFNNSPTFEHQIWIGKRYSPFLSRYSQKVKPVEAENLGGPGKRLVDQTVYVKIRGLKRERFCGKVYNFEVSNKDHSYVVGGVSAHNCRVPYDVCTKCAHQARTRAEYCKHLKNEMLTVYPDGTIAAALNPRPKFFDISIVIVRAAKEAAVLAKVASALRDGNMPVDDLLRTLNPLYGQVKIAAGQEKLAELKKYFPAVYARVVKPLYESEAPLPPSMMDSLCGCSLPEALSSTASMGIVLRPQEFQRLYLTRTGRPGLAEQLASADEVFRPSTENHGHYRMSVHDIIPRIVSMLQSVLEDRSVFHPHITRRIMVIRERGPSLSEPDVNIKTGGVLDELGREYAKYVAGMAYLPSFLKSAMERQGELYDSFADVAYDGMTQMAKTAGLRENVLAALGLVIPTYLLAAKWGSDIASGEDLGTLQTFIAQHPTMTAAGLLTGGHYLRDFLTRAS